MTQDIEVLVKKTFHVEDFNRHAMDLFELHFKKNKVYRKYCQLIGVDKDAIHEISQIPFLPIELFRSQQVSVFDERTPAITFKSSSTTSSVPSKHYIFDLTIYEESIVKHFTNRYGEPEQCNFLALLPNYIEKGDSSLVYMMNHLMSISVDKKHGFYLHDFNQLNDDIKALQKSGETIFLIGVTYALLDFSKQFPQLFTEKDVVMETGGMKGRKKEMTRKEVHSLLKNQFDTSVIHSEYGMTELQSQAYSSDGSQFSCPPWMKVLVHDQYDPLSIRQYKGKGVINIIDFANIYSCPFIATSDQGELFGDGRFSVEGRVDNSSIRGCSLMYSNE